MVLCAGVQLETNEQATKKSKLQFLANALFFVMLVAPDMSRLRMRLSTLVGCLELAQFAATTQFNKQSPHFVHRSKVRTISHHLT